MEGRLFRYGTGLQAFESCHAGSGIVLVILGGLTDGLLPCKYVEPLVKRLKEVIDANDKPKISVIQPLLRSSFAGFGTGTLERDVADLSDLFKSLELAAIEGKREALKKIYLLGHSTGCQISVYFAKHCNTELQKLLCGIILQAPVSDRESLTLSMSADSISELLSKAADLQKEGKEKSICHMLYDFVPLTAERCLDLFSKGGRDDMFSSDLPDSELLEHLSHLESMPNPDFKSVFAFAEDDQYVPEGVYPKFIEKIKALLPKSADVVPFKGNHSLDGNDSFPEYVVKMLTKQ